MNTVKLLTSLQNLSTTGARAVAPFYLDGVPHLAIPQLAKDLPATPAKVEGGDSNVPVLVFRWSGSAFVESFQIPATGSEDVEPFWIGSDLYLAVANLRSGAGSYELNVESQVLRWSGSNFELHQSFPTFAAKQWRAFEIDGRHFLALAQGVEEPNAQPRNPSASMIFEWDGSHFQPFQEIESVWGYNWLYFSSQGQHLLAYADHKAPSRLLRWTGRVFETLQVLDGDGGRAFCAFNIGESDFLAFARLTGDTVLFRRSGERFEPYQTLSGPGGREFAFVERGDARVLIQVNFLTGSRENPKTDLSSHVYQWTNGEMKLVESFPTKGATGAAILHVGSRILVAVSESLSAAIRFRTDSHIYELRV
ncbi:hypothetical protein MMC10_011306 [Thelotrema lepadinum]|nr:hypothetical protein [Thelotrema lepadinum]